MTEAMQGILAEAKKNKYSLIKDTLSEDDVAAVWENVSSLIEKQMSQMKGVSIPMLGTFTFTQKKLDIGNNKFIVMQRPVFILSEKFAQTHGLQSTKYHVPGTIPVVQLNFSALSFESPFDRDAVEGCVKEILGAVSRAVGAKKNVELTFTGIGRLSIRDSRVKMRFYKEFINQMDGSGKLMDSMQNRPGTVDSVMSDRIPSRPASSTTVVLPKISSSNIAIGGLAPVAEQEEDPVPMPVPIDDFNNLMSDKQYQLESMDMDVQQPRPPSNEPLRDEGMEGLAYGDIATTEAIRKIENIVTEENFDPINVPPPEQLDSNIGQDVPKKPPLAPSRAGSRMAMPMAKATGVSLLDDLIPSVATPKSAPSPGLLHKSSPAPLRDFADGSKLGIPHLELGLPQRKSASPKLAPLERSQSLKDMNPQDPTAAAAPKPSTPPGTSCGHPNAGQELCYLCHQRARRNVPVSFTEERRRREDEEDKLLQQFQYMKDAEETLAEQENHLAKRHGLQKIAAFNLGVAEAVTTKKKARDTDFHKSYIFQRRPLTPPKIYKQQEYSQDLGQQVHAKDDVITKRKADEEFLERLEQVQLAEDLAAQREQFLKDKQDQQDMYKRALEAQISIRDLYRKPDGLLCTPEPVTSLPRKLHTPDAIHSSSRPKLTHSAFSLPMIPKVLKPFGNVSRDRLNEDLKPVFSNSRLRFKPLQLPPREPDNEVFGKNDMTNEKMADRRRRAYDLFRDQQDLVAQRKREAILKRLTEQKDEESVLDRTKNEFLEDRAGRFKHRFQVRRKLEDDWSKAVSEKRGRDMEEKLHQLSPGLLLHEQCDKYSRCQQCKRKLRNCGESNIWSESRYIPGSRLMV